MACAASVRPLRMPSRLRRLTAPRSQRSSETWMWNAPPSDWLASTHARSVPSLSVKAACRPNAAPTVSSRRRRLAVAVAGFVTRRPAQADLAIGTLDHIQAARAGVGARMVIDHGTDAVLSRIDQPDQSAVVNIFQAKRAIQSPPQPLQNLREISGFCAGQRDAPRQSAVKMRVAVDQRRHEQAAAGIHGVSAARAAAPHPPDTAVGANFDGAGIEHPVVVVERQDSRVGQDHDATMCVPAGPFTASATRSVEVIMHSSPPCDTNSMAASILGPMDPAGNSPAARYSRACSTETVSSQRWSERP